jgi:predicted transcriptional regulator
MAYHTLELAKKISVQQQHEYDLLKNLKGWTVDDLESTLSKLTQKKIVKCRQTEGEDERVISLKVISDDKKLSLLASLDPKEQVFYGVLERFKPHI